MKAESLKNGKLTSLVKVPASDADKAQRGCGALIGPAPFMMSGKEVYVAPSPDNEGVDDIDDETDPEQTQRLALARDIARRQSGAGLGGHGHGAAGTGTSPDYLGTLGKT